MIDSLTSQGHLQLMITDDLNDVLALRNHPKIRRYMLTQHVISIKEHASWFERLSHNPGIELLVFKVDCICCGFVQIKETTNSGVMDWGFYVAPDAPKGTGTQLGIAAINYIFKKENVHKICGQVLFWNVPSIKFHRSLGFVQEVVIREQHPNNGENNNLVYFGMLKREWTARQSLPELYK